MKKQKTDAQKNLTKYKVLNSSLNVGKYLIAETPACIMLGLNWDKWFKDATSGVSIGMGFAIFLITVVIAIVGIAKKDKLSEKLTPLLSLGLSFIIAGVICLFFATILADLGKMVLLTGLGILTAVADDIVQKKIVSKKVAYWQEIVDKAGLNEKEERKKAKYNNDLETARKQAEELKKKRVF